MKVIPVMDILNVVVVHALRGKREEYHPVKSVLCESADPVDVALAFKTFGFNQLYLADLDAILGKPENFLLYKQIKTNTNLDLMVDAGITDIEKAKKVLESEVSRVIIGTETLSDMNLVKQAIESFGKDRVVVSLDLKEGRVVSRSDAIRFKDPPSLVETLREMGVTRTIVLDLARVGTGQGVNLAIVKEILEKVNIEVLTGGGVSDIRDLKELRDIGVSGALVATALHTGKLTAKELKTAGFL